MNKAKEAVTVNLFGIMENLMKVNGDLVKKMVMEFGDPQKVTITKEVGKTIFKMERDVTIIRDVLFTEAFSKTL